MPNVEVDRDLDLKGEVCPYTFVWSKLELEEMASGQVLRVTVDNETSARDVPRSLRAEGHTVLAVDQVDGGDWRIVVRKA